jgi:heme-degrading monooxygenase HmoA
MKAYASGNWLIKQGKEAEFVQKWRNWLEWSRDHAHGLKSAKLMRSADDPRRFVSMSKWESEQARADWKTSDEFKKMFAELRGLTDEFVGGDYNTEVTIKSEAMAGMSGTA